MSENIPYIIAEDGYYYVAYKEKVKVPELVVSSKGIANGLSEEYNDGWDFGPDTYSPTSTSAIPYTQTGGIMEAWNYAITVYKNIKLMGGLFLIDVPLEIGSQSGLNSGQQNISIEGAGYMFGLTSPSNQTGATIIQISNNFDVSTNTYMIQIGQPSSIGASQYNGSFGNISLNGISPNGSNQVQVGIWINNIFDNRIYNINNPIGANPSNYLIFQEGFGAATGNAPIIENITSYGCSLHFEPNAECLYSNISADFSGYYDSSTNTVYASLEVGCTSNNGDSGPVMTNVNIWNPDVSNDQAPAIKLIGGAGTNTTIHGVVIHSPYNNFPIIDASESTTDYDNATTGSGYFIIDGLSLESTATAPLINWGNNTNTGVNILINGINIPYSNAYPLLVNASGNTTPFHIKVVGGIISSGSMPALTSYSLASGQLFELDGILYSAGTTSTAGTTAGTVINKVIDYSPQYKKLMLYFNGYENDTTTNQSIDYPRAFSSYAGISLNTTGLTISASTSGITITAPDSTTTYSGIVIVEGY